MKLYNNFSDFGNIALKLRTIKDYLLKIFNFIVIFL